MLIEILGGSGGLLSNLVVFVLVAFALVISLSFHEFAHAYVSEKLGDPTARSLGRVTLNPKAHLDPVGTLMLLIAGFGWGKPVPFNPYNLKNPKRDAAVISFAGPAANFALAVLFSSILHFLPGPGILHLFLFLVIQYNLLLGFFNLIPVHPLDGFKVVNGFLPPNLSYQWLQMAPFGIWILFFLIITGVIQKVLQPLLNFFLLLLG